MNHEETLFATAVDLPAAERAAYLDRACAGDAALRERLDALLRAHDDAGSFMKSAASGLGETVAAFTPHTPSAPQS